MRFFGGILGKWLVLWGLKVFSMSSGGTFLESVARDLWRRLGVDGLREARVFLPSLRSRLFFNEALATLTDRVIWLPEFADITEEMSRLSGLRSVDTLTIIPELHRIFCEVLKRSESLEDFYFWGEMLLSDFDQIDKYLINADLLFRNLAEIHALDSRWEHLDEEQRELLKQFFEIFQHEENGTELKQRYLAVWQALRPMYAALVSYMEQRGEAYEGYVYRRAATLLSSGDCSLGDGGALVFIGFNALNACEVELFDAAKRTGRALFYWNYADYFLDAQHAQEAGRFLRRNLERFPDARGESAPAVRAAEQRVRLVSVPSVLSQVYAAREELEELRGQDNSLSKTALVLADESLLLPQLQELPEWVMQCNVTMGYPIRGTLMYTLLEHALAWLRSYSSELQDFSASAALAFLRHPYVALLDGVPEIVKRYAETKESRLPLLELWENSFSEEVARALVGEEWVHILLRLLEEIAGIWEAKPEGQYEDAFPFLLEYAAISYERLEQLGFALQRVGVKPSVRLLELLLPQVFRDAQASFFGEPLGGLQLMGFLETRALDFENVIVLSCNESFLPVSSRRGSFILSTLGTAYGLPTLRDREAMYAYYFRTLLSRASRVTLVYVESGSLGERGEPSRYVQQLRYFPIQPLPELSIYTFSPSLCVPARPVVSKEGWVRARLEEYFHSGKKLSPTAINAYIDCPLRFFYRYVAKMESPDEQRSAEISALDFGNVVHGVLEELYGKYLNTLMTEASIEEMRGRLDGVLQRVFLEICRPELTVDDFDKLPAVERINHDTISLVLEQMLEVERNRVNAVQSVHALEKKFDCAFALSRGATVRLEGKADRIDRMRDGSFCVIDYKTGKDDVKLRCFRSIEKLFSPEREDRGYVLQVFLYVFILSRMPEYAGCNFRPALWFLRADPQKYLPGITGDASDLVDATPVLSGEFESALQDLLEQLFDWGVPFCWNGNKGSCKSQAFSCPYFSLCGSGDDGEV